MLEGKKVDREENANLFVKKKEGGNGYKWVLLLVCSSDATRSQFLIKTKTRHKHAAEAFIHI